MRHDERHAALAAYALWCKLEQTGLKKVDLYGYYKQLFNVTKDYEICPACVIARRSGMSGIQKCEHCPCEWESINCDGDSLYNVWISRVNFGGDAKIAAGDIANIMCKWCERVGVIAQRSW